MVITPKDSELESLRVEVRAWRVFERIWRGEAMTLRDRENRIREVLTASVKRLGLTPAFADEDSYVEYCVLANLLEELGWDEPDGSE